MSSPEKNSFGVAFLTTGIVIILLAIIIYLVLSRDSTTHEKDNPDYRPAAKTEQTSPGYRAGKEIFMKDCYQCHVSKNRLHNHLQGVVDKIGVDYLEVYLSKQDSLLKARDAYALALKEEWGNNVTVHQFDYSETEFKNLIEYLKDL